MISQGFPDNSILPEAKCSAAEAQSKKSVKDFFDKLKRACGFAAGSLNVQTACVKRILYVILSKSEGSHILKNERLRSFDSPFASKDRVARFPRVALTR